MAEGFRFIYLAFRWAHGLVRCKHERRCSRACSADVSFRDVTIETPDRKFDRGMWMTLCTGSVRGGFGGFEKKSVSRVLASEEDGWLSELAEALRRVCTWFGADWKVVIERLCLFLPHVEKPFNSKVIKKSFVPELRSRQVFFVFRDSYVIYIWVMNILCTFHVSVYLTMLQYSNRSSM